MRPSFVNELDLKVTVISLKRCDVDLVAKSWQTRRKSSSVLLSKCERKTLRHGSECQNLRNVGLLDNTRLQTEVLDQKASEND